MAFRVIATSDFHDFAFSAGSSFSDNGVRFINLIASHLPNGAKDNSSDEPTFLSLSTVDDRCFEFFPPPRVAREAVGFQLIFFETSLEHDPCIPHYPHSGFPFEGK